MTAQYGTSTSRGPALHKPEQVTESVRAAAARLITLVSQHITVPPHTGATLRLPSLTGDLSPCDHDQLVLESRP